jgi:hypothetical protein
MLRVSIGVSSTSWHGVGYVGLLCGKSSRKKEAVILVILVTMYTVKTQCFIPI